SDQFQYVWQPLTGNFDIRVRLNGFSQTDAFAQAGLLAREDLTPSGRFAGVLATPSINGSSFVYRSAVGAASSPIGNLRVNYPNFWLRLQRAGNSFTGFGSYDGVNWLQLGTTSLALSNTVYFGMAVCSHSLTQNGVAQFRDIGTVTNATVVA